MLPYDWLVRCNALLSWVRRRLGISGYWSLAGYAKRKVKKALQFVLDFEDSVIHSVRQRGLDGVICGHIHSLALREVGGLIYANCGDWVDSCTAIVEHADGCLEAVVWAQPVEVPLAIPVKNPAPEEIHMRVLMVSDVYFPRVNGVSTSMETFRHKLAGEGVECQLVVPRYGTEPDVPGIIRVRWSPGAGRPGRSHRALACDAPCSARSSS
jgi:hypothetical protein